MPTAPEYAFKEKSTKLLILHLLSDTSIGDTLYQTFLLDSLIGQPNNLILTLNFLLPKDH